MKHIPLARLAPTQIWHSSLHPGVAWIVLLMSALAAGWAMQLSIDHLAAAADARARLERQSSQLERFQSGATPLPALQALRASHDEAVQKAARQSRWIAWGSLAWMAGVGLASVLTLQRRARPERSDSPVAGDTTCAAASAAGVPTEAAARAPEASQREWQSLRQEIEALRDLIDAPDLDQPAQPGETPAMATPTPVAAVVRRIEPAGTARPPFDMLERTPQLELRLAA
ncbi:MAG TPA: hypothetical protein PLL72_17100 [Burkholderiaceae bacterium]|nr:hypothetical protein [Burkholderiaceae bacterium]